MSTPLDAQEPPREPNVGPDSKKSSLPVFEQNSGGNRPRKSVPHWLLEGLFIVVSVALGFAVAQFGEYRANRELVARVLAGIEAEMTQNLAALEPFVPVHQHWLQALEKVDRSVTGQSGFTTFFAVRPALPAAARSSFPILRRSAWDTAVSGNALRLIDYDVVALLSDTYRMQEIATANVDRRLADGILSSVAIYDPANRAASIELLQFTLRDIVYAETTLAGRYREHLPRIRAAANAAR